MATYLGHALSCKICSIISFLATAPPLPSALSSHCANPPGFTRVNRREDRPVPVSRHLVLDNYSQTVISSNSIAAVSGCLPTLFRDSRALSLSADEQVKLANVAGFRLGKSSRKSIVLLATCLMLASQKTQKASSKPLAYQSLTSRMLIQNNVCNSQATASFN